MLLNTIIVSDKGSYDDISVEQNLNFLSLITHKSVVSSQLRNIFMLAYKLIETDGFNEPTNLRNALLRCNMPASPKTVLPYVQWNCIFGYF